MKAWGGVKKGRGLEVKGVCLMSVQVMKQGCLCVNVHVHVFVTYWGPCLAWTLTIVRTNTPQGHQRPVLMRQNVISEVFVQFRGKVCIDG